MSSDFTRPFGVAVETTGDVLVTDLSDNTLNRVDATIGSKAILAQGGLLAELWRAGAVAVGPTGDVFVASVDPE